MSIPRTPALSAAVIGALVAGLFAASPAVAAADEPTPTTTINGYRNVGYYGQWRATGEAQATIKRLFVDGPAGQNLTHLNYSFGNIAGDEAALDGVPRGPESARRSAPCAAVAVRPARACPP